MKILYVEDDYLFGMTLKLLCKELGYECIVAQDYDAGIKMYTEINPRLLIVDVNLKCGKDGVELVEELQSKNLLQVPVIFLTSEISDDVFDRARKTNPFTFLNKPLTEINLKRIVELALSSQTTSDQKKTKENDTYFIRDGQKFIRLQVSKTKYIEVEDKYCTIHTEGRSYMIRTGLKSLKEYLPESFVQIHRSYMINLDWVDSLQQTKREISIGDINLPVGRNYYDELKSKIQYLEIKTDSQ